MNPGSSARRFRRGSGFRHFVLALTCVAAAGLVAASIASATIEVSITSPTSGRTVTGVVPVQITASATQGVYGVQLYVDGVAYGSLDTTQVSLYRYVVNWDTSTAAQGSHTLTVSAIEWSQPYPPGGAVQFSAPVTVNVGSAGPTISITSPAASSLVRGTVSIQTSVTSSVSPTTVTYAVDGASLASSSWSTTTTADGTHTLSATVRDGLGRQATASEPVTVDNTPPVTAVVAPADGSAFTATMPVQASASDAFGVRSVQFAVDGQPVGAPVTAPTTTGGTVYAATLDLAGLAVGAHVLTDVATDNAGNVTTSAGRSFTVRAAAPVVTISAPPDRAFARGVVPVVASVQGGTAPFTGTLLVDGVATAVVPTVSGSQLTFAWSTTGLTSGSHTIAVTATDSLGASGRSATLTQTVDNVPPAAVMYLPAPLPGYTYARTNGPTGFQVHASDGYGVASVQFTVDGSPVGALVTAPDAGQQYLYSITFDTSTLPAGMHSVAAVVTDNAGNTTAAQPLPLKSGPLAYLPVLNYHSINAPDGNSIYDQTPAEADAQLAYLKANGYQSVNLEQYQAWLATGALPTGVTKPVLITVDDGLVSQLAWDPLLRKYGFTAVMFVVTGFADGNTPGGADPDNMTWTQIQSLAANGRWEIAFHAGRYGHGDYSSSTTRIGTQSYPSTCWWFYTCLSRSGRTFETPAAFETAVANEVAAGTAELKAKVPSASLVAWACPWNACGQWTNQYDDSSGTVQSWLPAFMASKFPIVFTQTNPITYGLASGTVGSLAGFGRHYRFEVHTDTTIAQFAAALADQAFADN